MKKLSLRSGVVSKFCLFVVLSLLPCAVFMQTFTRENPTRSSFGSSLLKLIANIHNFVEFEIHE